MGQQSFSPHGSFQDCLLINFSEVGMTDLIQWTIDQCIWLYLCCGWMLFLKHGDDLFTWWQHSVFDVGLKEFECSLNLSYKHGEMSSGVFFLLVVSLL